MQEAEEPLQCAGLAAQVDMAEWEENRMTMSNTSTSPTYLQKAEVEALVKQMVQDGSAGISIAVDAELVKKQFNVSVSAAKPEKKHMGLSDFPAQMRFYSIQASANVRNLVLAGIAIIWIFKRPEAGKPIIPGLLNTELFGLGLALALDFLQYVWGSVSWRVYYWNQCRIAKKRQATQPDYGRDISASGFVSIPIDILFYGKIVVMAFAYYGILKYVYDHF